MKFEVNHQKVLFEIKNFKLKTVKMTIQLFSFPVTIYFVIFVFYKDNSKDLGLFYRKNFDNQGLKPFPRKYKLWCQVSKFKIIKFKKGLSSFK